MSKRINCRDCGNKIDGKGCRGLCTSCYRKWRLEYQNKNSDKLRLDKASYYQRNKDDIKSKQKIYRQLHKSELSEKGREYRKKNKKRLDKYYSEWSKNNQNKKRNAHLLRKFGINLEQYNTLLQLQKGKCAICGRKEASNSKPNLSVDHDHKTGNIRGLLCNRCNIVLGLIDDSIDILATAIDYLNYAARAEVRAERQARRFGTTR